MGEGARVKYTMIILAMNKWFIQLFTKFILVVTQGQKYGVGALTEN